MPGLPRILPELMAPAGDWDCARAAVENGADAVYFGLQGGFNARARAANFSLADLPKFMTFLRARGVKGYLTLNTLVFDDEWEDVEQIVRRAVAAGVDAVLVQDLGLLRLVHRLCPDLPLHASTQMTLSSDECIRQIESLGVRRVVLPRELSIDQIAAIHQQTERRVGSLRPRSVVHQLLGPMPGEPFAGRPQRQSRPVRPAVPAALRSARRRPRRGRGGPNEIPAQPARSGRLRPAAAVDGRRRCGAEDRGAAETARVCGQRYAPLPRGS